MKKGRRKMRNQRGKGQRKANDLFRKRQAFFGSNKMEILTGEMLKSHLKKKKKKKLKNFPVTLLVDSRA